MAKKRGNILSSKGFYNMVLGYYPFCIYHKKALGIDIPSHDPHHIVGKGLGGGHGENVFANGVGLCRECHNLIHDGKYKLKASWLRPDQIAYILKKKWQGWDKIIWDNEGGENGGS